MSVKKIAEVRSLLSWLGRFPKHPHQIHGIHEADSEIIRIAKDKFLAITVDSISEEIAYGLYADPYTMGWVTAMASLSDLAAVGAEPEGFLFSAQLGRELDSEKRVRLALGLRDALKKARTPLLGGDTGAAASSVLSGVALGWVDQRPVTRIGIRKGDLVCITGKSGYGPALGFSHLLKGGLPESGFRPQARVREGLALRGLATSSMDTSDGIAATLHALSLLNEVGFQFFASKDHLDRRATDFCKKAGLPVGSLWFGEHGDFELIFTIPEKKLPALRRRMKNFSVLGKAVPKRSASEIKLGFLSDLSKSNLAEIRSAFEKMIQYVRKSGFSFE